MSLSYEEQIIQELQSLIYQQRSVIDCLIRVNDVLTGYLDAIKDKEE